MNYADVTHGSLISKASSSDCTMALLVVMWQRLPAADAGKAARCRLHECHA